MSRVTVRKPSRPTTRLALAAFVALSGAGCTAIPQAVLDKAEPLAERSTILASDGSFLASIFADENRRTARLEEIPSVMRRAIIASEDSRFYAHGALDMRAVIRALVTNVGSGDVLQGGSTITQQLAKLMFAPTLQIITPGSQRSGKLVFVFDGRASKSVAWNATAEDVTKVLEALPGIGTGHVEASGGPLGAGGNEINVSITKVQACDHHLRINAEDLRGDPSFDPPAVSDSTSARTLSQKILEARLALWLEQHYTKDEILAQYLNRAYFGHQSYGIVAAAETYFDKKLSALTLPEAALLAGLVKEPSGYDPMKSPSETPSAYRARLRTVLDRRGYVLDRMIDSRYITAVEADAAKKTKVGVVEKSGAPLKADSDRNPNQFFVSYVKQEALNDPAFGQTAEQRAYKLCNGGLTLHTTLNASWNQYAWDAISKRLDRPGDPEAALVAIDAHTGAIRAMIGGDYRKHVFNYAAQGGLQPGSSFKPFVLAAALEEGYSPQSRYDSSPGVLDIGGGLTWKVGNSDGQGHGYITIQQGLVGSINGLFARLVLDVGPDKVADVAARAGIPSAKILEPECNCAVPSIALGSKFVSPLDMATAYSTFAENGLHYPAHGIASAKDRTGKTILGDKRFAPKQAIDPAVAYKVTTMLQDVVRFGTGTRAQISGWPIAGKTGTNAPTSGQTKDVWFVGYTPDIVTAVWVGYPPVCDKEDAAGNCIRSHRQSMYNVHGVRAFGGTVAAPIWHDFMAKVLKDVPRSEFSKPDATLSLRIHNGKPNRCDTDVTPKDSEEKKKNEDATILPCPTPTSTVQVPVPSISPTAIPSPTPSPPPSPPPSTPPPTPTPTPEPSPSPTESGGGNGGGNGNNGP